MPGTLIALGGAEGVWEELEKAQALCPDADIGAVNEAGAVYRGHLTLWATLHPDKFRVWQRRREQRGGNDDYIAVAHKKHANNRVDRVEPEIWSGSSGLYVCRVAVMALGYQRVIGCGMPLDRKPHFFDSKEWAHAENYRRGWREALDQPELRGRIRTMSGWTRGFVGAPDPDWLAVPAK